MALLQDRTDAFIVRVWCEANAGARPAHDWRGSIEHVASGRRLCFRETAALAAFVEPYIDLLFADEATGP
jgi:hypothetical protein